MKRIKSDKIILEDRILDGYLYFENGVITDVTTEERPAGEVYDVTGCYVSPGFIDIHTHGGGGYRFEGSTEEIVSGCNFHLHHGTTSICPTVSAAPFASMAESARHIRAAMADPRVKGTILGVHMEGPYLSAKQAGAQCPTHVTPPMEEDYLPFIREAAAPLLAEGIRLPFVWNSSGYESVETLEACRKAGVNVPRQAILLGVDNDEIICEHSTPPLSRRIA